MSEELLINYTPMESRMAVLTDGVTSEILIERHQKNWVWLAIFIWVLWREFCRVCRQRLWILDKPELHFLHANDMQNPSVVATA